MIDGMEWNGMGCNDGMECHDSILEVGQRISDGFPKHSYEASHYGYIKNQKTWDVQCTSYLS